MSDWTIELIRTEVGPPGWLRAGRREKWLWRAYKGAADLSDEARAEMYERNDYLLGVVDGRVTPKADALADAQRACEADDLRRGQQLCEVVGFSNPGRPADA